MAGKDDVIKELIKYLSGFDKNEQFLKKSSWVEKLCSDDKLRTAYRRAKKFGTSGASYSNLHKVLDFFKIIPEE